MYVHMYILSPKELSEAPSPLGSRCSISQENMMPIKYATYVCINLELNLFSRHLYVTSQ